MQLSLNTLLGTVPANVQYQEVPARVPAQYNRIAVIGDMPYDAEATIPFSNSHYSSLRFSLMHAGIDIEQCLLTNVLPFYHHGFDSNQKKKAKKAALVGADSALLTLPEETVQKFFKATCEKIKEHKPSVIIILGRTAFRLFKHGSLDDERGAPFLWEGIVAIGTHHPKEVFVQYKLSSLVIADCTKALKLSQTGWTPPSYNINFRPDFNTALQTLIRFCDQKPYLFCDIETNWAMKITCIGFAWSKTDAIVIPILEGSKPYWSVQQEALLWRYIARVCETCKLIGHNALHFDHQVLCQEHGIMANFVGDTMFAHWECYAEMEKSLAFCSSFYTENPYWKDVLKLARSGKIPAWHEFEYNGRDNIICAQIADAIKGELDERPKEVRYHYQFNIRVSRVFQYMSIAGVRFDNEKRKKRVTELIEQSHELTNKLALEASREINVRSPKQMKDWLYRELKLPVQYKTKKNEAGDYEDNESADYLSLLYLARLYPTIPALSTASDLRKLLKRLSALETIETRPNGRLSWGFNVVGTDTSRVSGYKPLDGKGVQPQNVDSRDRDLFLADEDCFWLKADLEGADSWTVAAQCQALGDANMMNDLLGGIKPAQALAIAHVFDRKLITAATEVLASYKGKFKERMKEEEKLRGPKRTTYDVMKAVSHGSNYAMKKNTMHDNIFKKSEGELFVPANECEAFQRLYYLRYPGLVKLQAHMTSVMNSDGFIDTFAGTRRYFLGRRDTSTLRQMLSQAPQSHTTYATNRVLERLFYLPENRIAGGPALLLRPINQVHDEINLNFPQAELERAREVFKPMTNLPMRYFGVEFTIPFEADYGDHWGNCKQEF